MILKIQVISMLFSFTFGIFFAFIVSLNYRFLFLGSRKRKIISNFLLFSVMGLAYFLILKKINNAILHYYFLILFLAGFFLYFFLKTRK